jgi:hypothetical protein
MKFNPKNNPLNGVKVKRPKKNLAKDIMNAILYGKEKTMYGR